MKTYKEFQKEKRRFRRQELRTIESHLHPSPDKLNNCNILHEHKGQYIYFSAWLGDNKVNTKSLKYHRLTILNDRHFYNNHSDDFKWLAA
jgi:hypothetical protein